MDAAQRHVNRLRLVSSVGVMPVYLPTLTRHDAWMLGVYASTLSDVSNWVLSDLLAWVEDNLEGERNDAWYAQRKLRWDDLLSACGKEYSHTVRLNMAAVARAWPWARRRHTEVVKYRHHRLLVGCEEEEQEEWLDRCEAGQWSSSRLEQELAYDRAFHPSDEDGRGVWVGNGTDVIEFLGASGIGLTRMSPYRAALRFEAGRVVIGVGQEGLRFVLEKGEP